MNRKKKKKQPTQKTSDIDSMIQPKHHWEFLQGMTVDKLERTLSGIEYQALKFWDKSDLTEEQFQEVRQYESITSFGKDVANLFEDMVERTGFIPTQSDFIEEGIRLTGEWWFDNQMTHPKLKGFPYTTTMKRAVANRMGRTWVSQINEIHSRLVIEEALPHCKVITHDLLDLVAGVDLVVEDTTAGKRYYVHIFKNTDWGMKSFKSKEKRGGLFKGSTFMKYNRNFTGDVILAYEWDTRTDHTSTKFINGIPLFKKEFIEWKFQVINRKSLGESLTAEYSKLKHLEDWVKDTFQKKVQFK